MRAPVQGKKEFHPRELALAVAVENGDEILGAIVTGADDDENALPFVLRVLEPHVEVDAVGPEIDIACAGEITLGPHPVFLFPLLLQSHDSACGQSLRVLSEDSLKGFREVARGDPFQIKDRDGEPFWLPP